MSRVPDRTVRRVSTSLSLVICASLVLSWEPVALAIPFLCMLISFSRFMRALCLGAGRLRSWELLYEILLFSVMGVAFTSLAVVYAEGAMGATNDPIPTFVIYVGGVGAWIAADQQTRRAERLCSIGSILGAKLYLHSFLVPILERLGFRAPLKWLLGPVKVAEGNGLHLLLIFATFLSSLGMAGLDTHATHFLQAISRRTLMEDQQPPLVDDNHQEPLASPTSEVPSIQEPFTAAGGSAESREQPEPSEGTTATQTCGYSPEQVLAEYAPSVVGLALVEAYLHEGAEEIGCPNKGVDRRGRFYVAELTGGKSEGSLVVASRDGKAAVVFGALSPFAINLVFTRRLAHVGARTPNGYGDYQFFFLKGNLCRLAIRNSYAEPYRFLPPGITHAILRISRQAEAFPVITQVGSADYLVTFRPGFSRQRSPIRMRLDENGSLSLKGWKRTTFPSSTTCRGVSSFDGLAHELEASVQ